MRALLAAIMLCAATASPAETVRCRGWSLIFTDVQCELPKQPAVKAASFCDVMNAQGGPFEWASGDTEETKDRADLINAAGKKLCGWRGKGGGRK